MNTCKYKLTINGNTTKYDSEEELNDVLIKSTIIKNQPIEQAIKKVCSIGFLFNKLQNKKEKFIIRNLQLQ